MAFRTGGKGIQRPEINDRISQFYHYDIKDRVTTWKLYKEVLLQNWKCLIYELVMIQTPERGAIAPLSILSGGLRL